MKYADVPKDFGENVRFRLKLREWAKDDTKRQAYLRQCCEQDPLFFVNAFCWLYEPRPRLGSDGKELPKIAPFITWPHQDPVILAIEHSLGFEDIGIEKSRGEGASWISLMIVLRRWLFQSYSAFGLVSRNELAVDSPDDPDSLMWKLDWELTKLPKWLVPKTERNQTRHILKNCENGSTIVGYAATGDVASGGRKAQPLTAKVLTPHGWTTMGQLSIGDEVIGRNGLATKVTGVFPQGIKEVFNVTFSDGAQTQCCDDHLWKVQSGYASTRTKRIDVLPLKKIRSDYRTERKTNIAHKYSIPIVEPVQYNRADLPVSPYLLGFLLGDGHFGGGVRNTVSFATNDSESVAYLKTLIPEGLEIKRRGNTCDYRIASNKHGANCNPLSKCIRELMLARTRSHNKFIPPQYMVSSVADRLELLRGLLDTDGSVVVRNRKSASCEVSYASVSHRLATDVQHLVWSLGGVATMKDYQPKKHRKVYVLRIRMPEGVNPFRLSRKAKRYIDPKRYPPARKIVDVKAVGWSECQCISVASKEQLYVTDDFIVTHNTAFLMDELAKFPRGQDEAAMDSTQHVTECRLIVSTPKGPDGAYAKAMKDSEMKPLVLDWKDNISRNRNLYRVVNGMPVAVDAAKFGPLTPEYADVEKWSDLKRRLELRGYSLEGKLRSPWYDRQCLRVRATPKSIAQELDRDYGGSMSRFFDCANIDRLLSGAESTVKKPRYVGDLSFDVEDFEVTFTPNQVGHLRVWCSLDLKMRPPDDVTYIVSADIAMGTGGDQASNTVICATIKETGEKVAEFASPNITPEAAANYAVAMCKWFKGKDTEAMLIWETNGPGGPFRERVVETGFRNVYRRLVREETSKKRTMKIGWYSTTKTKHELLSAYNYALQTGQFVNPSEEALAECKQFQIGSNGKISHIAAESATDPTGAGENHGDRVIADALGHWARQQSGEVTNAAAVAKATPREAPPNSFAGRRAEWLAARKRDD